MMERMTRRGSDGTAMLAAAHEEQYTPIQLIDILLDRLAAYEDTGLEPEEVAEAVKALASALAAETVFVLHHFGPDRTHEIMTAEAEGRLVVLPCKENTPMWRVNIGMNGKPTSISPTYFNLTYYRPKDVGTKLFFTREEAEAVLEKEETDHADL